MKDLELKYGTTFYLPDKQGDIEIEIDADAYGFQYRYLPFEELEKWVMAIRREKNGKERNEK